MRVCGDLKLYDIYLMIDESIRAKLLSNNPLYIWWYLESLGSFDDAHR